MKNDEIKITILPDGTIKTETDPISGANHASAEAFLKDIARMAGGETERIRKKSSHTHTHAHGKQTHKH